MPSTRYYPRFALAAWLVLMLAPPLVGAAGVPPGNAAADSANAYARLLSPDPELARIGALPEPLPFETLVEASLLVSGVPASGLADSEAALSALVEATARATEGESADPAARAEAVLLHLHERGILRTYAAEATTLSEILEGGRYNCVSSALLYFLVMRRLGIDVEAVRTLDHAFCMVRIDGREIDVETTNAQGFDPGTKKEFTDAFGRVTGFSYVPPGSYGRRWTIGEKALLALVLSNRAALLERDRRFDAALGLGLAYDALTRNREGRDFLLDRINNFAGELARRGDFSGAAAFAEAAARAYGPEPRLESLLALTAYNHIAALAGTGGAEEALAAARSLAESGKAPKEILSLAGNILQNMVAERLRAKDLEGARSAVETWRSLVGGASATSLLATIADAELSAAVSARPFPEALALVEKAAGEGSIGTARAEEFYVYLYGNEANRIAATGDWLGAAALAREGAARVRGNGNLDRAAEAFTHNFVAEAHNRFAALYNARRFTEAKAAVVEALMKLPGDSSLGADLALVKKALGE